MVNTLTLLVAGGLFLVVFGFVWFATGPSKEEEEEEEYLSNSGYADPPWDDITPIDTTMTMTTPMPHIIISPVDEVVEEHPEETEHKKTKATKPKKSKKTTQNSHKKSTNKTKKPRKSKS